MSMWTQVAGIIRVDSFRFDKDYDYKTELIKMLEQDDYFGKQYNFYDSLEYWDTYNEKVNPIPMGSEGSLKYEVIENPNKSSMDAFVVVITGSLRDYDDAEYIISWFKNVCRKISVRQGVITVYAYKNHTYTYER